MVILNEGNKIRKQTGGYWEWEKLTVTLSESFYEKESLDQVKQKLKNRKHNFKVQERSSPVADNSRSKDQQVLSLCSALEENIYLCSAESLIKWEEAWLWGPVVRGQVRSPAVARACRASQSMPRVLHDILIAVGRFEWLLSSTI